MIILDAIREVQKYSHIEIKSEATILANADAVIHMRLVTLIKN